MFRVFWFLVHVFLTSTDSRYDIWSKEYEPDPYSPYLKRRPQRSEAVQRDLKDGVIKLGMNARELMDSYAQAGRSQSEKPTLKPAQGPDESWAELEYLGRTHLFNEDRLVYVIENETSRRGSWSLFSRLSGGTAKRGQRKS